jgi:L-2-hydroxyglutarate oxidase
MAETLAYPGFRQLARKHWRMGSAEIVRSLSRHRFAEAVRRLVPDVRDEDLQPAPAGIRAQAVTPTGGLVDDFLFSRTGRVLHVLNAPSPAATAALPIGRELAKRLG